MTHVSSNRRGFTLMETVIAIGVLAVLLTAFLAVFGPATAGIRRAISAQEADRLTSTLEQELTTLRVTEQTAFDTAFDKAFEWIQNSAEADTTQVPTSMIYVYQYRADPTRVRDDGTLAPYQSTTTPGTPGVDYVVQSMARPRDSANYLAEDLEALEGRVFAVRTTQLILGSNGAMSLGTPGSIQGTNPPNAAASNSETYPDAVIAFSAEFYAIQSTAPTYLTSANGFAASTLTKPVFTRSLTVRR